MPKFNKTRVKNIIKSNRSLFKSGTIIKAETMYSLFNITTPYRDPTKTNMYLLSAYTNLNKELNQHGLHIKSKNYYSEFHVLGTPEILQVVKAYDNKAYSNLHKAKVLSTVHKH